jgi:hypothetical protein
MYMYCDKLNWTGCANFDDGTTQCAPRPTSTFCLVIFNTSSNHSRHFSYSSIDSLVIVFIHQISEGTVTAAHEVALSGTQGRHSSKVCPCPPVLLLAAENHVDLCKEGREKTNDKIDYIRS